MTVRTRFAPSPTGYLHIGGARTAIFSWLYARSHGGQFILRIEDTDTERSTDESIQQILDAMEWLGIDYDEGPFRQTERTDLYQSYLTKLLNEKKAYRCVCTREVLDAKRQAAQKAGRKPMYDGACRGKDIGPESDLPFVIRFATPKTGATVVTDLLRGNVRFENSELDDMIIARSDGTPTYNFVVVVDDADMKITHVIRGDDHLANTPRQAVIYDALGLDRPKFVHVSMILGDDGKRLSKRHGALSVLDYRDKGIFPEAFVCYMTRLGWSHGDREVFTIDELKRLFDVDGVSKSPARFDEEKMTWVNAEVLRSKPDEELAELVHNELADRGIDASVTKILPLMPSLKIRSKTMIHLTDSSAYFFTDELKYNEKSVKKLFKPDVAPLMADLADRLADVDFDDEEALESCFNKLLEANQIKLKKIAQPVRLALTGGTVSPGLYEVMRHMGKERSIARIRTGGDMAANAVDQA